MTAPTRQSVLSLYRRFLETGSRFVDYNFREYTLRKARHDFRQYKDITDTAQIKSLYDTAVQQYTVLQRQVLINSLYSKGDYVIEKTANTHKHQHPQTRINKDNISFSATPRTADTALDNETNIKNRQTPEHYASKGVKEPATAIPS